MSKESSSLSSETKRKGKKTKANTLTGVFKPQKYTKAKKERRIKRNTNKTRPTDEQQQVDDTLLSTTTVTTSHTEPSDSSSITTTALDLANRQKRVKNRKSRSASTTVIDGGGSGGGEVKMHAQKPHHTFSASKIVAAMKQVDTFDKVSVGERLFHKVQSVSRSELVSTIDQHVCVSEESFHVQVVQGEQFHLLKRIHLNQHLAPPLFHSAAEFLDDVSQLASMCADNVVVAEKVWLECSLTEKPSNARSLSTAQSVSPQIYPQCDDDLANLSERSMDSSLTTITYTEYNFTDLSAGSDEDLYSCGDPFSSNSVIRDHDQTNISSVSTLDNSIESLPTETANTLTFYNQDPTLSSVSSNDTSIGRDESSSDGGSALVQSSSISSLSDHSSSTASIDSIEEVSIELPDGRLQFIVLEQDDDDQKEKKWDLNVLRAQLPAKLVMKPTLFVQMPSYDHDGMNLEDFLSRPNRSVDSIQSLLMFKQIVTGMCYLHNKGIVHSQICPFYMQFATPKDANHPHDYIIKIGGYSLSRFLLRDKVEQEGPLSYVQTEHQDHERVQILSALYQSPEQQRTGHASSESDVFSLGVLLAELFHPPYECFQDRVRMIEQIRERELPSFWFIKYPLVAAFVMWLLSPKPESRPTIVEVAQSELIQPIVGSVSFNANINDSTLSSKLSSSSSSSKLSPTTTTVTASKKKTTKAKKSKNTGNSSGVRRSSSQKTRSRSKSNRLKNDKQNNGTKQTTITPSASLRKEQDRMLAIFQRKIQEQESRLQQQEFVIKEQEQKIKTLAKQVIRSKTRSNRMN